MSLYVSYQRPHGIISQDNIAFLENNSIVTCPWGHNINDIRRIFNEEYTPEAKKQDRRFVNDLNTNDLVIIPLPNKEFLLKKIINNNIRYSPINYKIIEQNGRGVDILTEHNYQNSRYNNNENYQIVDMVIAYKECENLGRFRHNFNGNKFGQMSLSKLKKEETINEIRRICNI